LRAEPPADVKVPTSQRTLFALSHTMSFTVLLTPNVGPTPREKVAVEIWYWPIRLYVTPPTVVKSPPK
jgi:hypothetical protein